MDKFKKITAEIRENLAIITIIPIILGGIWQIFSLASISISYIRFFSPTQLISDGLLWLFILTVLSIVFRFGFNLIKNFNAESDTKDSLNLFWNVIKGLLMLSVVSYYDYKAYESMNNNQIEIINVLIILFMFFITISTFIKFVMDLIELLIKNNLINFGKISDGALSKFFTYIIYLIFFAVIILTSKGIIHFHKIYSSPKNLINSQKLLNKYCLDRKIIPNSTISIRYFNDKYIFIQNKADIEILKFDEFFFESNK